MSKKLIEKIPSKVWTVFAIIFIMMIVGPELLMGIELMALVNLMGADLFILLAFTSFYTLSLKPVFQKFIEFERESNFFIPSKKMIKENPNYLILLVPERTLRLLLLCFIMVGAASSLWSAMI